MLRTLAMLEVPLPLLRDLWANLRVADIVDVLVVSVIVYAGMSWFRRARSRFVMLGVVTLVVVYVIARLLDLTLTLVLFQAGITVALVALVVIFQEEIRRAFERLGNPGALRGNRTDQEDSQRWVDDVVSSATSMARSRTGALIVFKGREPLDRHLRGGTVLDGRVSEPLLLSIFDSSSPGHDGAVVVEGGWVRSFGRHLPLSTHIAGDERFGTRHTAALGLSESSDAIVLVVSEERGEISLAIDGKLSRVESASELGTRLQDFLRSVAPEVRTSPLRKLTRNLAPKALSLLIAVVTWVVVVGPQGERVGRTFQVPVSLHDTPEGYMLDQPRPPDVLVTLTGSERTFRRFNPETLVAAVNAGGIRPGAQRVELGQESIDLPRGLVLERIDPSVITLVAHETVTRAFPVHPVTDGKLPKGVELKSVHTEPEKIKLVVRKSDMGTFRRVDTEAISLEDVTETTSVWRGLSVPPGARLEPGQPASVRVVLELTR